MIKKTDETSSLFQIQLFSRSREELLMKVKSWLKESAKLRLVMTPNPEQVVQSQKNQAFLSALQSADLLLPDGIGLIWAANLLDQPIAEKISGIWLVKELLKMAKQEELKVLVIGGREYAAQNTISYQDYSLAWTAGYQQVAHPTRDEEQQLEERIRLFKPDLVFVAFGAPQQELWLCNHRTLLEKNQVKVAMAVGGSFDFLLGKVKRAPRWIRELGLEWLFRLVVQPWRWRRQLRLFSFIKLVLEKRLLGQS